MLDTILVAVIGAFGTIFAAYLIARTNSQDRALEDIHIDVNSRMTEALEKIERLQEVISTSRLTGEPVPNQYGRRSTDLQGDEGEPTSERT